MDKPLSAESHYVPKFYLKNWSLDSTRVQVYRTIVKCKSDPLWTLSSIRSLPVIRNLYTDIFNGEESDRLEKWFNEKVEVPASRVIRKVKQNAHLSKDDYDILVHFLAAQIVRTPSFFFYLIKQHSSIAPQIISQEIYRLNCKLQSGISKEEIIKKAQETRNRSGWNFPVKAHIVVGENNPHVRVETYAGRTLWQYQINHLLTNTEKILHHHIWTIIHSASGVSWATSDDPVICLNYHDKSHYDFGGGWGRKNCNIIFPLTPHYVMFTQVGIKSKCLKYNYSPEFSALIQRLILEHAYHYIFSETPIKGMSQYHPRIADINAYENEMGFWKEWGNEQLRIEREWNG